MSSLTSSPSALEAVTAGPSIRHFLLRRLHSLTGIVFGGYLVVHLLVNATLAEGRRHDGGATVFQVQVDKIHSLPFLLFVETAFIYLPILYHTLYGIWITVTGKPNVTHYPYSKNWFYVLQRVSAVILVFFMLFHILGMKGVFGGAIGDALTFDPRNATETAVRHFKAAWWIWGIVYPVGILASCYHLANGFWTAGITWGLTISAKAQKRWGLACSGLFVLTFACGITALTAVVRSPDLPLKKEMPDVRGPGQTSAKPIVAPAGTMPSAPTALTPPVKQGKLENGVRVESAVEWRPLEVGGRVFKDSKLAWTEVPKELSGRSYTCASNRYQATIAFTVIDPGPVMLACTYRWGGGSKDDAWKGEVTSRANLEKQGWKETATLVSMDGDRTSHWAVFTRDCQKDEAFAIRTEKYAAPILIR